MKNNWVGISGQVRYRGSFEILQHLDISFALLYLTYFFEKKANNYSPKKTFKYLILFVYFKI